ncbi:hypothetical protein LFWB_0760 [Candidatus Phytoplasma luffae]|uniref:Uncharacterized protein n=1 Tax=Loofah witches'-broom phytoplasma TaxID=35773 RepID=A0A975INA7_LOWBP|nr:hypothetical protein LFWB_0760 [Candidatus Phytoplasma luffae]
MKNKVLKQTIIKEWQIEIQKFTGNAPIAMKNLEMVYNI